MLNRSMPLDQSASLLQEQSMECSNGKYRLSTKNTIFSTQEKYTRWRKLFPSHLKSSPTGGC